MFNLTGKVAFVTGASSGIGRASAIALASQGAKVAVAARRIDKLNSLVEEIKAKGHDALAVQMDVTKKEEILRAVAKTVEAFGRLDILLYLWSPPQRAHRDWRDIPDRRRSIRHSCLRRLRSRG